MTFSDVVDNLSLRVGQLDAAATTVDKPIFLSLIGAVTLDSTQWYERSHTHTHTQHTRARMSAGVALEWRWSGAHRPRSDRSTDHPLTSGIEYALCVRAARRLPAPRRAQPPPASPC